LLRDTRNLKLRRHFKSENQGISTTYKWQKGIPEHSCHHNKINYSPFEKENNSEIITGCL